MAKIYFLVALLFVAVAAIMAEPVENESLERSGAEEAADLQERLSCSFGLCGTHCILEGKAGGHCKNGVCYCVKK